MSSEFDVAIILDELTPEAPPALAPQWEAVLADAGLAPRTRRRWLLAAAAVLATAAVAAPALALRDEAVRLLGGRDAPEPVQRAVQPIAGAPASAYVRLRTSVGADVTLVGTTAASGKSCLGLVWEGAGRAGDVTLACGDDVPRPLTLSESGRRVAGSWVALAAGRVGSDVARLELVAADGASIRVPLSASHFLVEVPRWAGDAWLVAYGYGGLELHRHKLETAPSWTPPDPVGAASPVVTRDVAGRTWAVFNYPATGARRCFGVDTAWASGQAPPWHRRGSQSFRCVAEREILANGASLLGPDLWPSLDGSGQWLSVVGAVGAGVATVRLTLESGAVVDLTPQRQTVIHLVPLRDGERPVRADVIADSGAVLDSEPLR